MEKDKVIKGLECCASMNGKACLKCPYGSECCDLNLPFVGIPHLASDVLDLLKEKEGKQYNNHEVACILADLFGDPCACNFNDIDTWLPYKCDFRETCCPNPVGVACWEQYLKHKEW